MVLRGKWVGSPYMVPCMKLRRNLPLHVNGVGRVCKYLSVTVLRVNVMGHNSLIQNDMTSTS